MKENLVQKFNDWLINFVEQPNALFNNWPICPYARQARVSNNIEVFYSEVKDFTASVIKSIALLESKEVVIILFDQNDISVNELDIYLETANKDLMSVDYVILEDHPNREEVINGLTLNFKESGLLIIQKLSKLNEASTKLREKNYYAYWSKENLKDVVDWRTK